MYVCIIKSGAQHSLILCQLWTFFILTDCGRDLFLFFLWTSPRRLWSFSHPGAQDLSTIHFQLFILCISDIGNNPLCVSSLTLSSALSRISLSGKAPSRGIHWSRTSCGSENSSLTGTTRDPIGWSHALDNYRDKDTFIMPARGGDVMRGRWQQSSDTLTFMMSISSVGSRTKKWNASSHWGDLERSHTFR